MRGLRRKSFAVVTVSLALAGSPGCQSSGAKRVASTEPGLSASVEPGASVVEAPPQPSTAVTWADRHPLFSKPREYYDNSTSKNKVVRAATAGLIGVPIGLFGEVKQIVAGNPTTPR